MNNPNFYNTWTQMLAAYDEEELQFLEFNRLVPISGNSPETFSIRLYDILQSTCGQVESMMRIICDRLDLEYPKHPKFPDLFNTLNKDGLLREQIINSIKGNDAFWPWELHNDYVPKWWKEYNDTKHNLPDGFKSGNIGNTIRALAALYSLHCIAYYIHLDIDHSVLKLENWNREIGVSTNMYNEVLEKKEDPRPRSALFYNLLKFGTRADFD